MLCVLSGNNKHIQVNPETLSEKERLFYAFRKKKKNFYILQKKLGKAAGNGWEYFISKDYKISIGLWKELVDFCERESIPLKFDQRQIFEARSKKKEVEEFCEYLLSKTKDFEVRDEHLDAVAKACYYRYCLIDYSVGIGKTLIAYLIAANIKRLNGNGKTLILTVKPSLVISFYKEFLDFNKADYLRFEMLSGENPKEDISRADVVISNFQFLGNKLKDDKFWSEFSAIIVDEGHRISAGTIQNIINKCEGAKYRVGLTGSIRTDRDNSDYYTLLTFFGPIVSEVSKRQAIEMGRVADGDVKVLEIDYLPLNYREKLYDMRFDMGGNENFEGEKLLRIEKEIIRASKARINWLVSMITKFQDKNIIVFFNDVKGGYGQILCEGVKNATKHQTTFYIDQTVSQDQRNYFKSEMEKSTNHVLFATYPTFSTGESVKNLHVAIMAESIKDELLLNQAMGRVMRTHHSKDRFLWIDIVDNFSVVIERGGRQVLHKNYSMKWYTERKKYYSKEGFETEFNRIEISKYGTGTKLA